jgi:hypothetical protein
VLKPLVASAVLVVAIGGAGAAAGPAAAHASFAFVPARPVSGATPVFAKCAAQAVLLGSRLTFQVGASDPDGQAPTLTVTGPDGLSMTTETTGNTTVGRVSWTPVNILPGSYAATFTASDRAGHNAALVVTINVTRLNSAPRFLSLPPSVRVSEGQPISIPVRAIDDDGDSITLSAQGLPSALQFTDQGGGGGLISGALPVGAHMGSPYAVTIVASDGAGHSSTATVFITVTDAGGPPSFTSCPPQTAHVNMTLTFQVSASSPDGSQLTMTYSAPTGALVSVMAVAGTVTGTFSWTPSTADLGSATVTFTASDGAGHSASMPVTISVVR